MNNKGVAIRYGDVAPEAKENFVPTASESEFDTLSQLQQYNLDFPNYANPCELYQTVLDGTASAFPSVPEQANLGLWSERLSAENGNFEYTETIPKKYIVTGTGSFDNTCGYVEINGVKYTSAFSVEVNYGTKVIVKVSAGTSAIYDRCNIDFNNNRVLDGSGRCNFIVTGKTDINFVVQTSEKIYGFAKWWEAYITMPTDVATEEIKKGYPIELTLTSDGQYTSQGLTLTFDTYNNIYATRLKIKWLRITDEGITTLDEKEYNPDNAFYFCRNFVENYNKVVITFYSLNMPKNRLKLRVIDYGYGAFFYGDELRNVKITQELDPISTQISINVVDFTLDSKTDMEYSFQTKQPLSVYFNGELKATTFVKKSTRKAKRLWDIQSEDYIGLLDSIPYYGGIYTNKNAVELLTDIFTVAKVPYSIDDVFADATVTGYIPYTTCRDAIMQVAFAIQAVVDTSNVDYVNVYKLSADDEFAQEPIPLNRIMQGQNFADEETVTGVEVAVHSYKPIIEKIDVYDASESGTGQNIFVKFSEPLHDLSIINGSFAVDDKGNELKHTNYAVINANTGCILRGQQYEHTTQTRRKNNPVVLASEIEKVVSVENATLVSQHNIDNIIEKCYNWLIKTNTTNLKIVEGKHVQYGDYVKYGEKKYGTFKYGKQPNIITYDKIVNVGENIKAETEYLGVVSGRLIKQSFNLNGNIIVKEAVLK